MKNESSSHRTEGFAMSKDDENWDVFVSYARSDDGGMGPAETGWVSDFVEDLQQALGSRLGEIPRVFFDLRSAGAGNGELEVFERAASKSVIFIGVGSPAYTKRNWPRAELAAFTSKCLDSRRLFLVECVPLGTGDAYPTALSKKIAMRFYKKLHNSRATSPLARATSEYYPLILDLSVKIEDVLRDHRGELPPKKACRTVLIAQGTDDVEDDIDSLRRYLSQYSDEVAVLPRTPYPQGGEEFKRAFGKDLADADIAVQLLGRTMGKAPPDLPLGYTRFQFEQSQAARKQVIQWRHPEISPDTISNPDYKAMVNSRSVTVCGLEEFKARVLAAARLPAASEDTRDQAEVFINADRTNIDVAESIEREFVRESFSTALPKFGGSTGENRAHLESMLTECGVIVFVHGSTERIWLRTQTELFKILRPERITEPRSLAVCTVPPALLEKEPEGFAQIDCSDSWDTERVRKFILDLKGTEGLPADRQASP
jgi:hypothetical protein